MFCVAPATTAGQGNLCMKAEDQLCFGSCAATANVRVTFEMEVRGEELWEGAGLLELSKRRSLDDRWRLLSTWCPGL